LPTDGPANHGGSQECVDALAAEAKRLLKKLDATIRLPKPNATEPSTDGEPKTPAQVENEP